ncbi:SymE family type I addiction module toxin [Salmonella enterica]
MAEHDITPEVTISKAQRHITVGYRPKQGNTDTPTLNLSGKWLNEAGFSTGTSVTVKISDGCIVLMAENNEVRELREQLYQVKKAFKGIKSGMVGVLNDSE